MIRLIKLTLLAGLLAVPFWTWDTRLQPGTRAFAVGGDGYKTGAKLTVIGVKMDGRVAVRLESGEVGTISRARLHPIDFTIRP